MRERLSAPHVLFVALYNGDSFVATLERAARHLNVTLDGTPPQFHAVVNKALPSVPDWCTQHVIGNMPADAVAQHHNLSRGKPRGASVFLWKAFLYRLVPVDRIIVLDLDVVLTAGARLHGLWAHFESFGAQEVLGVVPEQGPTYARLGRAVGYNGGVQLHDLARMRATARDGIADDAIAAASRSGSPSLGASASWDATLRHCAAGFCPGWDNIEPSLGDQTLYSRVCKGGPHLCHRLPCGWNRQLSTRYYTASEFVSTWHTCETRCRLLHFNQPLLEQLVPELQRPGHPASCAECRLALANLENRTRASHSRNPKFTWGTSKVYMASVVEGCCCAQREGVHLE